MKNKRNIAILINAALLVIALVLMLTNVLQTSRVATPDEIFVDYYNYLSMRIFAHYEGYIWHILTFVLTAVAILLSVSRLFVHNKKLYKTPGLFICLAVVSQSVVVISLKNVNGAKLTELYIITMLMVIASFIDSMFILGSNKKQ